MSSEPFIIAEGDARLFDTERETSGHSWSMEVVALERVADRAAGVPASFEAIYERHFDFIWRALANLGVGDAALDDAAQDVFIVVHRRLASFEGRASITTWLYGIALRVARDRRRATRRKPIHEPLPGGIPDATPENVDDRIAEREAKAILGAMLDRLDDDKREVFVLSEIEELSAGAIADVLGIPLNTAYSRIRLARRAFDKVLARYRATEGRRGM